MGRGGKKLEGTMAALMLHILLLREQGDHEQADKLMREMIETFEAANKAMP